MHMGQVFMEQKLEKFAYLCIALLHQTPNVMQGVEFKRKTIIIALISIVTIKGVLCKRARA